MAVTNRIIRHTASGFVTPYTVPSGKQAVVTSITVCNTLTAPTSFHMWIRDGQNSNYLTYLYTANSYNLAPKTTVEILGSGSKLVLNDGDGILCYKIDGNSAGTHLMMTLMEFD